MVIDTDTAAFTPQRLVSGFEGHPVGGVGTPHWLKPEGYGFRYIEAGLLCPRLHLAMSNLSELAYNL
jgi:hypothetical protein